MDKEQQILELKAKLKEKNHELDNFKEEVGRLNSRLEKLIARLERDLSLSNHIQELLVPTKLPNIQGFEFSTKFNSSPVSGGDYYEVMNNEDKLQFGILLSSCSGYAMSALFLSILLKHSMQLTSRQSYTPEEFLQFVLEDFDKKLGPEDRFSLLYARVDRRRSEFSYAGFGKLLGFHYSHANSRLQNLKLLANEFGEDIQNFKPSAHTIKLEAKDRVVLLSEGLSHIKNPSGESLQIDALFDLIETNALKPIHQLRNEILLFCQKFSQVELPNKDQTIIVFDVAERVISLA